VPYKDIHEKKQPNLKLKTWPKQLYSYLLLAIVFQGPRSSLMIPFEYSRLICGTMLDPDKRVGPNYRVVVGDAIKFMEESLVRKFG
jgi:hypothetical protein